MGQEVKLGLDAGLDDLHLGGAVLLEVHSPRHSVLWRHLVAGVLDVLQLLGGGHHPGVQRLQASVKVLEIVAELLHHVHCLLEGSEDGEPLLDSLLLLLDVLLLVLRDGESHHLDVVLDGLVQAVNGGLGVTVDLLSLGKIVKGRLEVELLLDLLNLILGLVKFDGDGLIVLSVTNPGLLGVL